ncbi:MAG: hypothetical protein VX254_02750 [Planctomycetota bacterium]|nr:hypothetical protein [Planctomycetota bacterium]
MITDDFFDKEEALGAGSWSGHDEEGLARHDSDSLARVIYDEFLKDPAASDGAASGGAVET